jgi:hypothetical protein
MGQNGFGCPVYNVLYRACGQVQSQDLLTKSLDCLPAFAMISAEQGYQSGKARAVSSPMALGDSRFMHPATGSAYPFVHQIVTDDQSDLW